MDPITEALSMLQLTLLTLALDDRDEPFTPQERYELLIDIIAKVSLLVEEVGGGDAVFACYERFRHRLQVRDALGI